jgi:hypothetical protein
MRPSLPALMRTRFVRHIPPAGHIDNHHTRPPAIPGWDEKLFQQARFKVWSVHV